MRFSLIFIAIISIAPFLRAQDIKTIRDFRTITEISLQLDFFTYWTVETETCIKLEKNSSCIDEIDFDLNLFYTPVKFISLGTGYRLTSDQNRNLIYENKQRFFVEAEFNETFNRLTFNYRLRYQNIDDDYFPDEMDDPARNILRNRIQFKYNLPTCKLSPYINTELFGQIGTSDHFAATLRSAIGGRYTFSRHNSAKIYFRIDRELNSSQPFIIYNLGAGYTFKF